MSMATRPGWFERLTVWLILLMLGVLALRQVGSPDAGFHLATGRDILAGHAVPRTDTFTYTVDDHAYIDTSWGYDLVLAAVHAGLGLNGVTLLHAALVVAIFWIVVRTARLAPSDPVLLAVLLLCGGLMSEERFEVRPELFSYALLALVLLVLHRAEEARGRLWLLPPLFVVWANTHSLFVVGFGVLACFNLGAWLRTRRVDWRLFGASGAAALATLLNPYGYRGPAMSLVLATRLRRSHLFHEHISEYESPLTTLVSADLGFYLLPISCFLVFVVLTAVTIVPLWRQRRASAALLGFMFVPLALAMVRNFPLLAIACLPGTLWALSTGLERLRIDIRLRSRIERGALSFVALVAVGFGLRIATDAYYVGRGRLERFGFGWNRYLVPVDAVAHAARTAFPGRMLNDLNFGGYLIWALKRPVFIDGRLEVMGEEFFALSQEVAASPAALEACVGRYGIGWIIFPYRDRPGLLQMVAGDPRWQLAYFDHLAAVFVRADHVEPLPSAIIDAGVEALAAETVPTVDLATIPGLGIARRPGSFHRWLDGFYHRQSYPVTDYSLGVFHYLRGDWRRLAWYSAAAIRRSGGAHPELYANLGSALYALGDLGPARGCLLIARSGTPPYQAAQRQSLDAVLAEIDRELGRRLPAR